MLEYSFCNNEKVIKTDPREHLKISLNRFPTIQRKNMKLSSEESRRIKMSDTTSAVATKNEITNLCVSFDTKTVQFDLSLPAANCSFLSSVGLL